MAQSTPKDPGKTDFETMAIVAHVANATTNSHFGSNPFAPILIEFRDRALVLEVPPKKCARGHQLIIMLELWKGERLLAEFETTARVEELVEPDPGKPVVQIVASMTQYEEGHLKAFKGFFEHKQELINDFLRAGRGW